MHELEKTLAVIRRAIRNEITGQSFYSDAAMQCIDPWAKEIFADLAREEETHTRLLLSAYQVLTTEGRWVDLETALASETNVDITQFTFPEDEPEEELFSPVWSTSQVIDRRADDLAALAMGIQMEKRAIALYGQSAQTVSDPAAKRAYVFLIEEESRHLDQLKSQWERLAGMPFVDD